MKYLNTFLLEWKHFVRNPFKIVAILLFVLAGIYALHNGARLYKKQKAEIQKINEKIGKEREDIIRYYEEDKVGPEDRPWVNVTTPFWAIWSTSIYYFKEPSPSMVYSIGQAEQYGFYKQVTFLSSPYDTDMAEEIANPERLQTGTLDFSFVVLFLLPLTLLILVYNIKSYENEQGFLSLIIIQSAARNGWVLSRMVFYLIFMFLVVLLLLIYGALLTNVFEEVVQAFWQFVVLILLYLFLWSLLYSFILHRGKTILGNTLTMLGFYLLITFIIPAAVHQWVSIKKPTNLMTDYIDATRDKKQDLYDEPDSLVQTKLFTMFPELKQTSVAKDSVKSARAMNRSIYALTNQLMKESIAPIQKESEEKNKMIRNTYWFNPMTFFQNELNKSAETHYENYQEYRDNIQTSIDEQVRRMVLDIYNEVEVDKKRYLYYINQFTYDQ